MFLDSVFSVFLFLMVQTWQSNASGVCVPPCGHCDIPWYENSGILDIILPKQLIPTAKNSPYGPWYSGGAWVYAQVTVEQVVVVYSIIVLGTDRHF